MARRFPVLLLILSSWSMSIAPAHAGDDAPGTLASWAADAKANKAAQKEAEKSAARARPAGKGGEGPRPSQERGGLGSGDGSPGGGGGDFGGGPGGGMGEPSGGGGHGGPGGGPPGAGGGASGPASAADMLRPEMDFAAPLKGKLVMYRTRESVLFGRGKDDPVILPLSGDAVPIAPGITASAHEQDGRLHVDMATSNGIRVAFHYEEATDGALQVDVHAEGPLPRPGTRFDVVRHYRAPAAPHR